MNNKISKNKNKETGIIVPRSSGKGDNILGKIIARKKTEIAACKAEKSIFDLEKELFFSRKCISLKDSLLHSDSGIIAEFKRKSPSKGWIHKEAEVLAITENYCKEGASGISILTDEPFFGGTPKDLISARPLVNCPILRKDFTIDTYQIFEAKAIGADVILLIASALSVKETTYLAKQAKTLGLEVLLEIHDRYELTHINEYIDFVGVNNRNLKTFEVVTDISRELARFIPPEFIKISESGISTPETIKDLREYGYRGFLMGEIFMKEENPAKNLRELIRSIT